MSTTSIGILCEDERDLSQLTLLTASSTSALNLFVGLESIALVLQHSEQILKELGQDRNHNRAKTRLPRTVGREDTARMFPTSNIWAFRKHRQPNVRPSSLIFAGLRQHTLSPNRQAPSVAGFGLVARWGHKEKLSIILSQVKYRARASLMYVLSFPVARCSAMIQITWMTFPSPRRALIIGLHWCIPGTRSAGQSPSTAHHKGLSQVLTSMLLT